MNRAGGEACDQGGVNTGTCDADCTTRVCGDNFVNSAGGETCDQGGVNTATCDADCTTPTCGDDYVNSAVGEQCDSGGVNTVSCDSDCTTAVCGDAFVNTAVGEVCDDGVNDIRGTCPACRTPYPSCRAIHAAFPSATSGFYTIGSALGPLAVHCDMVSDGAKH